LRRASRELGREVRQVAPEALERLRRYSWPGNVRELQSVLKQAILRSRGPVLLPDFLPELPDPPAAPAAPVAPTESSRDPESFIRQRLGPGSRDLYKETHLELDRLLLPRVLEHTGGNQQRAALLLGITRKTLRVKLQDVGLHVAHSVEANENDLP
jgi:two-component system nitrogen regulation response regulator GlnG